MKLNGDGDVVGFGWLGIEQRATQWRKFATLEEGLAYYEQKAVAA